MKPWILFKFCGNYWCFFFTVSQAGLGLGHDLNPLSVGCSSSNVSSVLKSFQCYLHLSHVCTTHWPAWVLCGGLSVNSVLKVLGVLNRIKSTHAQLEVSSGVHKRILWGHFPMLHTFHLFPRNFLWTDTALSSNQIAEPVITSLSHVLLQLGQH